MSDNQNVSWININKYLKENQKFIIPFYQRSFVWKNEKIINFLDEIKDLYIDIYVNKNQNIEKQMFIGTIYLRKNENKKYEIIDGQQRTTFFYFIREYFLNPRFDYSLSKLLAKAEMDFNLFQQDNNNYDLQEKIKNIQKNLINFKLESVSNEFERLYNNQTNRDNLNKKLNVINKSFKEFFKNLGSSNNIFKFINFFFERISLIEVKINNDEDINEIFSSINSKGKLLNTWDLLRNGIFKIALNSPDFNYLEAEDLLKVIDNKFNEEHKENIIKISPDDFFYAYTIYRSKSSFTKKKTYQKFLELFSSKNSNFSIVDFKNEIVKFYQNFTNISDQTIIDEYKSFIYIVKELNLKQIYMPFLCLLMENEFSDRNFIENIKFMKKLLTHIVLNITIDGKDQSLIKGFLHKPNFIEAILKLDYDSLDELLKASVFYEANEKLIKNLQADKGSLTNQILDEINQHKKLLKFYLWINSTNKQKRTLEYQEYEFVLPDDSMQWNDNNQRLTNIPDYLNKGKLVKSLGNIILIKNKLSSIEKKALLADKIRKYSSNLDFSQLSDLNLLYGYFAEPNYHQYNDWDLNMIYKRRLMIASNILESIKENL